MTRFINFAKTITLALALALIAIVANANSDTDKILGNWKTESEDTAQISKCGDSFCIVLKTGEYTGQSIGKVKVSGTKYEGTVRDPSDDRTYTGNISVSGDNLKLQGCVMIFCRTQEWVRM